MTRLFPRHIGAILLCLAVYPGLVSAIENDPVADLIRAKRVFVPLEDLDVVIERDKQGVILPRGDFDTLIAKAKANSRLNAIPDKVPVVLTAADYVAQISGDQLLIAVNAEITQFDADWHETRFNLQRLAIEQARLDDMPAQLGRHPDGSVSLFTSVRGKHSLKLQLSTELNSIGSDQVAAFSLLGAPSGSMSLTLPVGKRLMIGNLLLQRPATDNPAAAYQFAIGGMSGIQIRITDRAIENAADSLMFATTGYGLNVAPGEVTWHALTSIQVYGKPVGQFSFSVPKTLEVADIEAIGLESWSLSDDPNDPLRRSLALTFGQGIEGTRTISLKGVMVTETGSPWSVPYLKITNATSHIGQVILRHAAGVRVRIEEASGVRRSSFEQLPKSEISSDARMLADALRFDAWESEFTLRLTTQLKKREVQTAVATVLDINSTGLEMQVAIAVESRFAPLFELDIRLPSEWKVLTIQRDHQPLAWQMVGLDEVGVNQIRVQLNNAVSMETRGEIRLSLRRDVDGWPVESDSVITDLPELYLPQSSISEGVFVVRGDEDLEIESLDIKGLDPQPLKADYERFRFQTQDTRYSGKLKVTRKPARIAVQTVTCGRIDPQTFHTYLQAAVEVQGGGIRSIKLALPESIGNVVRFESPDVRIVEQSSSAPTNGERIWTLQFDQRLRGQCVIICDIQVPRNDAKEFVLPQCRFIDAERQNGYLSIEASGDQRLTVDAKGLDGLELAEVDALELPRLFYQPKERFVAIHRTPAPGATVSITEQRFDKLPVPSAVCSVLETSSILGRTGEIQHRATFHLNVVGVQGLHVALPAQTQLWATSLNGHPVEVRRNGDVYLIPVVSIARSNQLQTSGSDNAGLPLVLELFYRSEIAALQQFGTLSQNPPTLTVESGQRTSLPVEVLEQRWNLYYPQETRLVQNHSPLEPQRPLDSTSLFGNWNARFGGQALATLGLKLAMVFVVVGIIATFVYSSKRSRVRFVAALTIVGIPLLLIALLLPGTPRWQLARKDAPPSAPATGVQPHEHLPNSYYLYDEAKPAPKSDSDVELFSNLSASPASTADDLSKKPMVASEQMDKQPVIEQERLHRQDRRMMHVPANEKQKAEVAQHPPIPENKPQLRGPEIRNADNLQNVRSNLNPDGLLSLAIDFVAPAGSRRMTFHYIGSDAPSTGIPLTVDYVDHHSGFAIRLFMIMFVVMISWFVRDLKLASRFTMATVGIVVPLALAPFTTAGWHFVTDGILIGSIAGVAIWFVNWALVACPCCMGWGPFVRKGFVATILPLLVALASSDCVAEESAAKTPEAKPTSTILVPYDAGAEPLSSDRVFLSHEQFLDLYRLANPDRVSQQPAGQVGGIVEAIYSARVAPNPTQASDPFVSVFARYAVRCYGNEPFLVELPVGSVSASVARLDGKTAPLISAEGRFKVAVQGNGLHAIDFAFDLPARISGSTGSFLLPLLPVSAGKLSFELPSNELSIRVNGSSTLYRRSTRDNVATIELPIEKGGEIAIAWQPRQTQGTNAAVIHVDSVSAMTLTDAGGTISYGFGYRVRQGSIADVSLSLPDNLRLQSINGPDVGGWELVGTGATRTLRVILRRSVADETRITIETFLDLKVGRLPSVVQMPQIVPKEVANEIGQIAVFADNQFSVRADQIESLSQIDSDKFTTSIPISRPNVPPQFAYRFSKRPFLLRVQATRPDSQLHVSAQQAALVTQRKLQITSRLRFNLTGSPRSSVSFSIPRGFVLLDAQATDLREWYVTKVNEVATLTIELNEPRLGQIDVVLAGAIPNEIGNSSIVFPQPLEVTRLDSTAAVWLDDGYVGTLESFDGWQSIDAALVSSELQAVRPKQPPQFVLTSTSNAPTAVTIFVKPLAMKMSANGLSMVTATDVAVVHTLALQWKIDGARTDKLELTTPQWLAGKLEFQAPGLLKASHTKIEGDRTRWTLQLRTPVSGTYFVTATAALPPAGSQIEAPAIAFESEQKLLDVQQQYVLLINSSLSQLTATETSLTETVQREDLPFVIQQEFVNQATELVRLKTVLRAPKWSLHKFAQQSGVPAAVNMADLSTILNRDGTYRAQAIYTIKNRSRQFLALKMPEGTELLSVFVSGHPSRAVAANLPSLNGKQAHLIALPKTSAASLSFAVTLVWSGRLKDPLPQSARFIREEVSVPAPQVISQIEDPEYGIPVARTRWTVYLPKGLAAEPVRSVTKHNLSLSNDSSRFYGEVALQEAGELLGYLEQTLDSNRRSQSLSNVNQMGVVTSNLKQLGAALNRFENNQDREFDQKKADILARMNHLERAAADEAKKTTEFFMNSNGTVAGLPPNSNRTNALIEGQAIANEQQNALISSNSGFGILIENQREEQKFNFPRLSPVSESKTAPKAKIADSDRPSKSSNKISINSNAGIELREQLQQFNGVNLDDLNSSVTSNNTIRSAVRNRQQGITNPISNGLSNQTGGAAVFDGTGATIGGFASGKGLGRRSTEDFSKIQDNTSAIEPSGQHLKMPRMNLPTSANSTNGQPIGFNATTEFGVDNGLNPQAGDLLGANAAMAQNAGEQGFVLGFQGGHGAQVRRIVGGLSLAMPLPTSGQKMIFTKTGGDPKLTLAVRPQETLRYFSKLIWSAAWIILGTAAVISLRFPIWPNTAPSRLPCLVAGLGIVGFCLLPGGIGLGCFVVFLISSCVIGWNYRTPPDDE